MAYRRRRKTGKKNTYGRSYRKRYSRYSLFKKSRRSRRRRGY